MSESLKTLLQQALDMLEEQALHIEAPMLLAGEELLKRIRAATSQQAEQAPVQDEREAFEAWAASQGYVTTRHLMGSDYKDATLQMMWVSWQARATRPAQTEQQPKHSGLVTEAMRNAAIAEYSRHDGDFSDFADSVIRAALSAGGRDE